MGTGSNTFYYFGGGLLFLNGREIGNIQDVTLDISMEVATLRDGVDMFPEIIENSAGSITGTASYAIINADTMASLFGEQVSASGIIPAIAETATIAGGSVALDNTMHNDPSGVISIWDPIAAAGTKERFVPTTAVAPAAGQFYVSSDGNTLTFNAADNDKTIKMTYFYGSSDGSNWSLKADSFPPTISLVLAGHGRDQKTLTKGYEVVIAKNVRITNFTKGVANDAEIQINNISFTIVADADDVALNFNTPG